MDLAEEPFMSSDTVMPNTAYAVPRRWPRYQLDAPVHVIVSKEDRLSILPGRGNELNEGGMAVVVGIDLDVDDPVAVEFTLPYTCQPIRVHGCIRNRNGYRYGVEFVLQSEADRENAVRLKAILTSMDSLTA